MKTIALLSSIVVLVVACTKENGDSKPAAETNSAAPGAMVTAESATPRKVGQEISVTTTSREAEKLFRDGRELQDNFRFQLAKEKFEEALELDPKFALAHAHMVELSGKERREHHMSEARKLAESLPDAERLWVQTMLLRVEGEYEKAHELTDKLLKVADQDWRVQMLAGSRAQQQHDLDGAIAAYEKAIELNDRAAQPHNNLAYMYAERGDLDKAIASVNRYAELKPGEPNPLDSKGEILLMAGKFAESEAAFTEAVKLLPEFAIAYEGIAATRLYRNDFSGGLEALNAAYEATPDEDKGKFAYKLAWVQVAAKQPKLAFAKLAELEDKNKDVPGYDIQAALARAEVALEVGDLKMASTEAKRAIELSNKTPSREAARQARWAMLVLVQAELGTDKIQDAEKTLSQMSAGDDDPYTKTAVHYARGSVAAAKGDIKTAKSEFEHLLPKQPLWLKAQIQLTAAMDKAGNKKEAEKLRGYLKKSYRRDAYQISIHKKLLDEDGES